MFHTLKQKVSSQFDVMSTNDLFKVDLDSDVLYATYLNSLPDEVRQSHTCNSCKQFIRNYGGVVTIKGNTVTSIWDFKIDGLYKPVVAALSKLVKEATIQNAFFTHYARLGVDFNLQLLEDKTTIKWEHLSCDMPRNKCTAKYQSIDTLLGNAAATKQVFKRSLDELSLESIEIVLELIAQNSLYRGAEFKLILTEFLKHKKAYSKLQSKEQDIYAWANYKTGGRIRNTAIGTLLIDLSEGKALDVAVTQFERIVAPTNYKRPTALITAGMISTAEKAIKALGIEKSLVRQHATLDDISAENLLHVNRNVMEGDKEDIFGILKKEVVVNPSTLSKVETISITDFIENLLPTTTEIEVLFEHRHTSNLISIIRPTYKDSPNILKWDNPFSWDYNGGLADSIKERVKSMGGAVSGELRVSLGWFNNDDLDIHLTEPNGSHIFYGDKYSRAGGVLDVDMNVNSATCKRDAVENIIYKNLNTMIEGTYTVRVNNFKKRENIDVGFNVEVENRGVIHSFSYSNPVSGMVDVLTFKFTKKDGVSEIKPAKNISTESAIKEEWGISTNKFHKVPAIMYSPNYWGDNKIGNRHFIFVINDAKNPNPARGLFNEMLKNELNEHRKVFEILGNKLAVPYADRQVSGLGFSDTQRNNLVVKVHSKFTRTINIQF